MTSARRCLLLAMLLLGARHSLFAQTCLPGDLRVIVKDSQEAPVFEVQVRIESGSGQTQTRTTGAQAIADFENVPCGAWLIHAVKQGFDESTKSVQIASGVNIEVSLFLSLATQHASVDVKETSPAVEQTSTENNELHPSEVKALPSNPPTVSQALPLVPGIVRGANGELIIDGSGEQRSAMVVNQSNVTDPATGKFDQTIPIDSVETVNVLSTPFLAQYGRFTQSVVAVDTRRGGEKWHATLNDPFPDFRVRSWHMRGIRNETPHGAFGGPLIPNHLYFLTGFQYYLNKQPSRTLGFPHNESKQEWINSFTQVDWIVSPRQILNATVHLNPQHTNFVNPDYFNPQPVTPTYAQHDYAGTVADHLGLFGGLLDSSISLQRFDAFIGPQGNAQMLLTPEGNQGNYFATQNRQARRTEWLEILSPAPVRFAGRHLLKIGTSFADSGNRGRFSYRPVLIENAAAQPLQRIDFTNKGKFNRTDQEITAYTQDHWELTRKIALDYGMRIESQQVAESVLIAPRAGFAWTPFASQRTVFRAGFGQFYDHIPLDVYTFASYPDRTVINYGPDGSMGAPVQYQNVIGSINGPRSFLVRGAREAGSFAPRGTTWSTQFEHSFVRLLRIRAVYTDNRSVGLIVLDPALLGTTRQIVLNGNGASRYRQAELTARLAWKQEQQLVLSYTHSLAVGNLNGFDTYLGNFSTPVIHPDVYSNLPGDIPNRLLLWGQTKVPFCGLRLAPIVEYRSGFPYAAYDVLQNYVGVPYTNGTRFPSFFSADARISKDLKINAKYSVRLSVTGFNLTNHFNPLAVHNNTADPQYGNFFGNYHRRYRFDFEVLF